MSTNQFFNHFNDFAEQSLIDSLNVESIQINGYDMYYLPRRRGKYDDVMNEDSMSYFDTAYPLEMYIRSVDGFEGEGSLMSKFGLEVRDRVTLAVSRSRYMEEVGTPETALYPAEKPVTRPLEGGLIYFAMTKKLFEIVYVDNRAIFYPAGTLPIFDLTCEVFEYSQEVFTTGISEIDAVQNYSADEVPFREKDINDAFLYNADGTHLLDSEFDMEAIDPGADNEVVLASANTITNIVLNNPFRKR